MGEKRQENAQILRIWIFGGKFLPCLSQKLCVQSERLDAQDRQLQG